MGSTGQNSTFSEHSHVAYQIKWNQVCSNTKKNILPTAPSPSPTSLGWGQLVKIQLFQNMVMLYNKLHVITNAATW